MTEEIPQGYGNSKIVIMVKDPYWIFSFWEITNDKKNQLLSKIHPEKVHDFSWALKILPMLSSSKINITPFFITLDEQSRNLYIHTNQPDAFIRVEYGLLSPDYIFISAMSSNIVYTPKNCISHQQHPCFVNIHQSYKKPAVDYPGTINFTPIYHNGSEEYTKSNSRYTSIDP